LNHAQEAVASPWASVIVPTHDRDTTLDLTIASIQAQTVRDIEILIAGDGVTSSVRSVIGRLTAQDARIRFLDQPKAPGRGYENRHLAVTVARAPRIFYSDDDDLWFTNHIARLGAALDKADVVDSSVMSLARSGRIHRAWVNHSHPVQREALATGLLKLTFDTHLSHSKALYLRSGEAWTRGVAEMLSEFAASGARWTTLGGPTALSVHGSVRRSANPADRRAELLAWRDRIAGGLTAQSLESETTGVWYLYQTLLKLSPNADDDVATYLSRLGVTDLPNEQVADLEAVFELFNGRAKDDERLERILVPIMEPLLGPVANVDQAARSLRRSFSPETALSIATRTRTELPFDSDLSALLRAELLIVCGRPVKARAILEAVVDGGARYAPDGALMLARQNIRDGRHQDRLQVLRMANERFPERSDISIALARALWETGQVVEARALVEDVLSAAPGTRAAEILLSEIGAKSPGN
jgi:glycosyltransferase involved in cell wall biosynthesis